MSTSEGSSSELFERSLPPWWDQVTGSVPTQPGLNVGADQTRDYMSTVCVQLVNDTSFLLLSLRTAGPHIAGFPNDHE